MPTWSDSWECSSVGRVNTSHPGFDPYQYKKGERVFVCLLLKCIQLLSRGNIREKYGESYTQLGCPIFTFLCINYFGVHVGERASRTLAYDEPSEFKMMSPLVQSYIISFVSVYKKITIIEACKNKRAIPTSYLMMFELSSAFKSLHKGLARIRQASAYSIYSSD